jgi:hypothetical protein
MIVLVQLLSPEQKRGYLRVPQQCGSEWKEPSERYEKLRM